MRKSVPGSTYTPDWPEVARAAKEAANWRCERCGHSHEPATGYALTVHHLDMNPGNNIWWNLAVLCQRCHLTIQAKVVLERYWMFEHSEWFRPHAAGYYASVRGLPQDREYVMGHMEMLLAKHVFVQRGRHR